MSHLSGVRVCVCVCAEPDCMSATRLAQAFNVVVAIAIAIVAQHSAPNELWAATGIGSSNQGVSSTTSNGGPADACRPSCRSIRVERTNTHTHTQIHLGPGQREINVLANMHIVCASVRSISPIGMFSRIYERRACDVRFG